MSRAFVKEGTGDLDPLPDLPLSPHPNYVTPQGLALLRDRLASHQADLAHLRARPDRLDKLPEAAAERDIRYLEARLRTAILVDPAAQDTAEVRFGHRIRVGLAEDEVIYTIVGEDESDATRNRIAPHSPLARALLGAGVGDTVLWRRPSGVVELEILDISHDDPPA